MNFHEAEEELVTNRRRWGCANLENQHMVVARAEGITFIYGTSPHALSEGSRKEIAGCDRTSLFTSGIPTIDALPRKPSHTPKARHWSYVSQTKPHRTLNRTKAASGTL